MASSKLTGSQCRFIAMLEGEVIHEDLSSFCEGGGVVEGRRTATSSEAGCDTAAASADTKRDQVLFRQHHIKKSVLKVGPVLRLGVVGASEGAVLL